MCRRVDRFTFVSSSDTGIDLTFGATARCSITDNALPNHHPEAEAISKQGREPDVS